MLCCLCISSLSHCSLYQNITLCFWNSHSQLQDFPQPEHFHIFDLCVIALTETCLSAKSITPVTAFSLSCIPPTLAKKQG